MPGTDNPKARQRCGYLPTAPALLPPLLSTFLGTALLRCLAGASMVQTLRIPLQMLTTLRWYRHKRPLSWGSCPRLGSKPRLLRMVIIPPDLHQRSISKVMYWESHPSGSRMCHSRATAPADDKATSLFALLLDRLVDGHQALLGVSLQLVIAQKRSPGKGSRHLLSIVLDVLFIAPCRLPKICTFNQ